MTKDNAIKFLQQLYPHGGHCWLDEQRIEAIGMAIAALKEEPVSNKKRIGFKAIIRLLEMIEPTDRAKSYLTRLIDDFEKEGYMLDADIAKGRLKEWNGETVAIATMDEEPKECLYALEHYTDEDRKVLCEDCEEDCKYSKKAKVDAAITEVEAKAKTFTESHKGESSDEILAQMRGKEPVSEEWIEELRTKLDSLSKEDLKKVFDKYAVVFNEEPASDDLEEASKEWLEPQLDKSYANYGEAKMMELTHFDGYTMLDAIEFGAQWQEQQLEKNRLARCDVQTEEEAEREQEFVMQHIKKYHCQPTFSDAIEWGMNRQREQMTKNAIEDV